ncbi:C-X-C chemokine receptor type 5 [Leptodactylus fuscus]|uniref:C-X-C chemokine receptor type 5 n=1 Tax=Leptodactylus fuscus TaxID=238119 RepID=UPI003F4F05E5
MTLTILDVLFIRLLHMKLDLNLNVLQIVNDYVATDVPNIRMVGSPYVCAPSKDRPPDSGDYNCGEDKRSSYSGLSRRRTDLSVTRRGVPLFNKQNTSSLMDLTETSFKAQAFLEEPSARVDFTDPSPTLGEILRDGGFVCSPEDDQSQEPESYNKVYSVIIPVLYSLVFVVGALGNSLVLFILTRNRRSRSSTDNFLLHLAIADLLMLFTFPFSIAEAIVGWEFGDFLCKAVGVISRLNFYCSSLLLGCISIDRFLSIIYAIHTFKKRSLVTVHYSCCIVWIICFLLSMPNIFLLGVQRVDNNTWCTYNQSHFATNHWWQAGRFVNHIVGFLLPMIVMTVCYTHIIVNLCRSPRREKKKAVRVAVVITVVFFLCWTPYNVAVFLDTLEQNEWIESCAIYNNVEMAITVTEVIGYMHCCLNPLLYAFVGAKFRNDALKVLKHMGCNKLQMFDRVATVSRKSSSIDSESRTVISSI